MRLSKFAAAVSLLLCLPACAQFTPYGLGLVQQPNAYAARNYLGVFAWTNGSGITLTWDASRFRYIVSAAGGGSGSVTNFQIGNLSPLFTTAVANSTTYPSVTFSAGGDGNASHYFGGDFAFHALPAAGSGTVTNFTAGNLSPLFTTSVSDSTTFPSLSFAQVNQSANLVFAGPSSGAAAAPTFRSLVSDDLPILPVTKGGTGRASLDDQQVLIGNGTANVETSPDLTMDSSGHTLTLGASTPTDFALHGGMHVFNTGTDVEIEPTLKLDSVATGSLLGVDALHQVVNADAPSDGNVYARSNGVWTTFSTGGGGTGIETNGGTGINNTFTNASLVDAKIVRRTNGAPVGIVTVDTNSIAQTNGIGTGLAFDGSGNLYVTGGAVLTNTDQLLTAQAPDSSGSNTFLDFSVPMRYWTGTGAMAFRFSTNWPATGNGRQVNIWIPPTNYVRSVYLFDGSTNWATAGIVSPMIIPGGVGSVIKASSGPAGETNVFVSFIMGNKQIFNSEVTFNPAAVPGMVLWVDAATGIYQDSAHTTPTTTTGQPVEYWADQSGAGNNLTNLTGDLLWSQAGAPNARPSIVWPGVTTAGRGFASGPSTNTQPLYVFCVAKSGPQSGGSGRYFFGGQLAAGTTTPHAVLNGSAYQLGTSTTITTTGTNGLIANWVMYTAIFDGVNTFGRTNGVSGAIGSGGNNTTTALCVGEATPANSSTLWQNGEIAEVLAYAANLSGQNLTNIERYLAGKYSLPGP